MRQPAAALRLIGVLGAGQLIAWGSSYYLLAMLARPMARALGLPATWVYAAFSATLVIAAALGPISGGLIDRHGGRRVLMASNLVFAAALCLLAAAQGPLSLFAGWALLGVAMPMGLYDAAFSTAVRLQGHQARRAIVGITLIGGFASSVSWPLTAIVEAQAGFRAACLLWAGTHLTLGLGLHTFGLPRAQPRQGSTAAAQPAEADGEMQGEMQGEANVGTHVGAASCGPTAPALRTLVTLAAVFTASGFVFSAMATQLPQVLQLAGATPALAVAAASLVGVAQVIARIVDAATLSRLHPLWSARMSMLLHPFGVGLLMAFGAPAAFVFAALHGAGIGIMTIVKGTLPLALFGPQGFGRRAGLLEAPSRVAQASAPLLFGLLVDRAGAHVLWLTAALVAAGFLALWTIRARRE